MFEFSHLVQIAIAAIVINVWLFRAKRPTPWRGAESQSLKEEFDAYGLPSWMHQLIKYSKVSLALLLLLGLWLPPVAQISALAMASLMLGAVAMHFRVGDPLKKSAPALSLLVLSLVVAAA